MTHQGLGVLGLALALNLVLGPLWGRSSQAVPTSGIAGRGSFTLRAQGLAAIGLMVPRCTGAEGYCLISSFPRTPPEAQYES